MKVLSLIRLVVVSALLVGVLSVGTAAAATTVYVGKANCSPAGPGTATHPYCTIQQGVDKANSGDTVKVNKGVYTEAVTVSKTLTLAGNQATVTASGADGMVLAADNILVIGFTFSGKTDGPAIQTLATHSGYTIRNNTITNNVFGIYLNSSGAQVTNVLFNHITANNQTGSASGNGIYSDQGLHNAFVSRNTIEHQDNAGMLVGDAGIASDTIRFDRNLVQNGGGTGLYLQKVDGSTASNNTFRNIDGNGVEWLGDGTNNVIRDNVMQKAYRGMRIGGGDFGVAGVQTNLLVEHNNITQSFNSDPGNGAGIYIAPNAMTSSTVFDNISNANLGDGILVDTGGNSGNAFNQNTARNNAHGRFDAEDRTTGTGTAGTANNWSANHCVTSSPPGLCSAP